MANPVAPETSFILLLRADSEHALPESDPEVVTALASYGAIFKKTKKEAPARLELLAGLMCVHAHQHDLQVVWAAPWTRSDAHVALQAGVSSLASRALDAPELACPPSRQLNPMGHCP